MNHQSKRKRGKEALGRRDMRRARKDNVDCLRFFIPLPVKTTKFAFYY
jgi:hypothetical protein